MYGLSRVLWHFIALVLLVLVAGKPQAAEQNILLIIADDFGVDAAPFYPTTVDRRDTTPPAPSTPNLMWLAQSGVLFRNAWATPWCSPTRATIFTGRYPFRTGVGNPISRNLTKADPGLSLDEFSLPEAFQKADPRYLLAHIGKWHISRDNDLADDSEPNRHGWPHFVGPDPDLAFLPSFYDWPKTVDGVTKHSTVYATTDQVDEAVTFIRDAKNRGKPYLVWLALRSPLPLREATQRLALEGLAAGHRRLAPGLL
jgi:arylsulfatase A-like enzyme